MTTIRRRDFAKGILGLAVGGKELLAQQASSVVKAPEPAIPLAPVPVMHGLAGLKPPPMQLLVPDAVADTAKHFFDTPEMATLRRLCEMFQPGRNGRPGAVDAGAPEFLDFLVGASPVGRQQMYRSGLERLDAEAKRRFGVAFAQVDAAQADALIRPWLRTWMRDHPPTEPFAAFINLAHEDIRTATVNSPAWHEAVDKERGKNVEGSMYWLPIEPEMYGKGGRRASQPAAARQQRS